MLIRFIVKNLFSFKEYTEFNLLPGRTSRMPHHLYEGAGTPVLKLNAMYGANGAGKSNLIKALGLLRDFVVDGELPTEFLTETFRFDPVGSNQDSYLGVEFYVDEIPFYYGITINQGIVIEEELQFSGLGKKEDITLFKRTDSSTEKNLAVIFHKSVMDDKEAGLFPSFLQNELLERNKLVLHYLKNRQNLVFEPYKIVFGWFETSLIIIEPKVRAGALAFQLDKNSHFRAFASELMRTFKTGVREIKVETLPVEEFFGEDDKDQSERIIAELKANPNGIKGASNAFEEIIFVMENNKAMAKRLYFIHEEDNGIQKFTAKEESDGTRRLLDYLPAIFEIITKERVLVIDEIERSIHPLLAKELIRKFSVDTSAKGQLIFSTHESNLLDQDIFRPDEIWFAEKKPDGATHLYALSEFKEHHTIDIRKGYLNGRYGGIPFLGNLSDLNWNKYAEAE
ncbi:MAG: ATP/GTP-binding protein [Lentimicrobium sp.]